MSLTSRFTWQIRAVVALTCALVLALSSTALAFASVTLVQLSSDPYTNTSSQHKTEVEPDNYSFGSTIVAVTQAGRFFSGAVLTLAGPLRLTVAAPGRMASCLARRFMPRPRVHLLVSAIPQLPMTLLTAPG